MLAPRGWVGINYLTRKRILSLSSRTQQPYRDQAGDCQKGARVGDWVTGVKGLRSTEWQLWNSHGEVKGSTGNVIGSIVMAVCGARCVQETSEGTLKSVIF